MEQFFLENKWTLAPLAIWALFWKGWAIWKSARMGSKKWFVVLFLINTAGLLEILYIFLFSRKKKMDEVKTTNQ